MAIWFEDMPVGYGARFGGMMVDRDEAIAFARAYDPQAFHLDDEAAAANPLFGRLSVSGWFTAALCMRMTVDFWKANEITTLGGAGLDELTWLKPVYPGDSLRCEAEVIEARASRSRPETGMLKITTLLFNQRDEPVMRQIAKVIFPRRPAETV